VSARVHKTGRTASQGVWRGQPERRCSRQILNAREVFENDFPAIMAMDSVVRLPGYYKTGVVKTFASERRLSPKAAERHSRVHITARFLQL